MKKLFQVIVIVVVIFVGLAVMGAHEKSVALHPPTPPSTPAPVPVLSQDPTLLSDAQTLGINVSSLNLVYGPLPSGNNDAVAGQVYQGEYDPNTQTIYVVTGMTQFTELQTLAYEYMHYVWGNLVGASFQQSEAPWLEQYEANSPALQQYMTDYSGSQTTLDNELDSTMCTEIDPSLLSTARSE